MCFSWCDSKEKTTLSEASFASIEKASEVRRKHNPCNGEFDEVTRNILEAFSVQHHGYHHKCYQKRKVYKTEAGPLWAKHSQMYLDSTILLPSNKCMFCEKGCKTVKRKEERLLLCETETADETIKPLQLQGVTMTCKPKLMMWTW